MRACRRGNESSAVTTTVNLLMGTHGRQGVSVGETVWCVEEEEECGRKADRKEVSLEEGEAEKYFSSCFSSSSSSLSTVVLLRCVIMSGLPSATRASKSAAARTEYSSVSGKVDSCNMCWDCIIFE